MERSHPRFDSMYSCNHSSQLSPNSRTVLVVLQVILLLSVPFSTSCHSRRHPSILCCSFHHGQCSRKASRQIVPPLPKVEGSRIHPSLSTLHLILDVIRSPPPLKPSCSQTIIFTLTRLARFAPNTFSCPFLFFIFDKSFSLVAFIPTNSSGLKKTHQILHRGQCNTELIPPLSMLSRICSQHLPIRPSHF